MKKSEEFEEGKPMEEYVDQNMVDELNSLPIEPEPNPEAEQRLENVVEPPVRNEKKKPVPPQITAPPVKQPEPPVIKTPEPTKPPEPQSLQQTQTPTTPEPEFTGLDDYINKTAEAVKQQWRNNAYRTLIGVVTGQLQVVQAQAQLPQQPQPQVQQQQQPERVLVKDNSDAITLLKSEVEKINQKIIYSDSNENVRSLRDQRRLLETQIHKLDGTYVEQPEVEEPVTPVSGKVANPQKEKSSGKATPKVYIAGAALFVTLVIAVVLIINSVFH